jgi:formiminotetrahydrofolate cyclodeaminase
MLVEMNLQAFVKELASDSPAPGGGSVAALTGALGAGLISMVRKDTKPMNRIWLRCGQSQRASMPACLKELITIQKPSTK